ncbi:MAG: hypothetical protein RLZ22_859, partial [Verrucomicrobiota bacterium]
MAVILRLPILAGLCLSLLTSCDRKAVDASDAESASIPADDVLPEVVSFNAHIRPIFSDTCFACHGFDSNKRAAGLRLDTPEGAYAKLKNSEQRAIVPGKPDESAILQHIFSQDPEEVMPPPEFHKELSDQQKSLIRAWIEQGAKYEEHWAFTPLGETPVPSLKKHADEVANPIDAFVLSALESEKIDPSPLADKATLLRRLSLDLIGLPPTPSELDAFLADSSPDAYAKQVERLLASPHYGERMAVPWLDVVRFADTVGYHGDQNARVFPYRDYVIKSFNDNKRFDQFTTEQLAGDLLPNATDEQRIATGFLRLNLMTREGGAQAKEYLAKYMGDRVRAVGAAWLGLTTGCAECHDHKFDPVTAKDFYSLGAFFADVRQWGVYADYAYTPNPDLPKMNNDSPFPPEIYSKNAAMEARLAGLQESAVEMLAPLKTAKDEAAFHSWREQISAFLATNPSGWATLSPSEIKVAKGTVHEISEDASIVFSGLPQKDEIIKLNFPLPHTSIRAIRLEVLPDPKNAGKVGRQPDGKFAVIPSFALASQALKIARSQADRWTPHKYKNGQNSPLLEAEWRSAPAPWEEPQSAASLPHHAIYHLSKTLPPAEGRVLQVTLASADIGKIRISVTPFGDAIPGYANACRTELVAAVNAPESSGSERELAAAWIQSSMPDAALPKAYRKLRNEIIACRAGYAHSLVAQAVPAEKIPSTHILPRGAWMNPAEEVQPAVPKFLPHQSVRSDGTRLNRLDLAKWLMNEENPLTARHFCNRLWKQFFGKG